jgi:putative flavoprotein involved in K+ transport
MKQETAPTALGVKHPSTTLPGNTPSRSSQMHRHSDVIVIGAGQAGLAMSHWLGALGIDHAILDRGDIGHRWVAERWPSLKLLSPNSMIRLPGGEPQDDPDGFMSAVRFAATLRDHARRIGAPVETGCEVLEVRRDHDEFRIVTTQGTWTARAVVIATGACDSPRLPGWAAALPGEILQVTTSTYRDPASLPPGGVLVVGASSTGVQLAAEIAPAGRPVTLAVGRHVRAPRRYRGRDVFAWLDASGFLHEPRAQAMSSERALALPSLQLIGSVEGRDIGLAQLAAAGVRIAGRATGAIDGRVQFAGTLEQECMAAEIRRRRLLSEIDRHIAGTGLDVAEEPEAWVAPAPPARGPATLDLRAEGIGTVLWATGFRRTYPWLKLPVLDEAGEIVNRGGVTPVPGLFALGLPFMRHRSSAFIYGVGRDARALADAVASHLGQPSRQAA